MNVNLSPLHRFAERLEAFNLHAGDASLNAHDEYLRALQADLPPLPADPHTLDAEAARKVLARRARTIQDALGAYCGTQREALAVRALRAQHAFTILFAHAHLLDALHRFAFAVASEDLPVIARLRRLEAEDELATLTRQLPRKQEREARLREERDALPADTAEAREARRYLDDVLQQVQTDRADTEAAIAALEAGLQPLAAFRADERVLGERLVLFARGGYGRAEMSFSSDVDTGYCLDAAGLEPAEVRVYHEFVLRVERLLREAGLETAHQFFELGEDLSRFTEPEALHTIPSILEGRRIVGSEAVLAQLKGAFRTILPFERFVRRKVEEFEAQAAPDLTAMDLKEDFGGLRSVQIPLWLLGVTHRASSFMTLDLLHLARQKKLLSLWEVSWLLLALELLYTLRNFAGAAEAYYYDREARESGFYVREFHPNRLVDAVARLYLFRTDRFSSIDALDGFRLRLVAEVQRISAALMQRVLDRTISHKLGGFEVSVHLGHKRIIAIQSTDNGGSADLRALFQDAEPLLRLFGYIAATEYDLSAELKDALAGVVSGLAFPATPEGLARQVALLDEVMGAPYAHRALETLFEIGDPLAPGLPTLMGRFIPALENAVFLVRRIHGVPTPLHRHLLRALACGQNALDDLRREHPELHALLADEHVRALKWALLLHGLGQRASEPERPSAAAAAADQAVEVLTALGYSPGGIGERVRLLIANHASVIALSRMATYMDQALAQFFEIADRSLVNVTLLYLVNHAVLAAQGEATESEVGSLRALFAETTEMLDEMRGFPVQERSLELINVYFDRKKRDLSADTRVWLLVYDALARGLEDAVFAPLRAHDAQAAQRVEEVAEELEALWREVVLGTLEPAALERQTDRLRLALRQHLGAEGVEQLTASQATLLSWFFHAFPNRYLMGALPQDLAARMVKFSHFQEADVIADSLSMHHAAGDALLIYTHGLERSHTRVAYALSRLRVNIASGKVNRVELDDGSHGYCYFFEVSSLEGAEVLDTRELELVIGQETPPVLARPTGLLVPEGRGLRVEFLPDDGKGYRVVPRNGGFDRVGAPFHQIRLVLRDEPFLFYKVSRAFDLFDVEIQQSLITTIGNQVVDHFYLREEDCDLLRRSGFEEVLLSLVHTDLLSVSA